MAKQAIYLLQFNSEVLFPSKNIKTLWQMLWNRCRAELRDPPEPYATVRRRIISDGKYVHVPLPGWTYQIIARELLHKSVQTRLPLNEYQKSLNESDLSKIGNTLP